MPTTRSAPSPNRGPARVQNAAYATTSQPNPAGPELVGMVALRLMADGHVELDAWARRGDFPAARRRFDALERYLADHKAEIRQAIGAA